MAWPGPHPAELADGSLVVSITVPRCGVVVVRAVGEIDLLTAPVWERMLTAATGAVGSPEPPGPAAPGEAPARRPRLLVCDLSAVTFLGATGCSVLVDLMVRAGVRGVEVCVVAEARGPVRRLLGLTGLDQRLALHRHLAPAVAG